MIVLAPDFMTKIGKKAAEDFHRAVSKVFDRVKSVALWSANIRKLAKDHKGYGSAARLLLDNKQQSVNHSLPDRELQHLKKTLQSLLLL